MNNKQRNFASRNWIIDLISISILLIIFYSLWIGSHPLFTPDEGRYSEVAREMVVTGDYVTPRLNGVAFLDKPVLYYWLQASAIKMFGLTEWALRFWPMVLGIIGTLVTYITGRLLFDRRTGLLASFILAASPLYYGAAHYANLDLEVASLVSNALLCFITAMQGKLARFKNVFLFAAYIFAGLAVLTKGLIGIVFPIMIIGAWILMLNRWYILGKMQLGKGLFIFILIAAPWYVVVQQANPEFLHFFFVTQQVSRFLTMQYFNNKAAVWFYVPIVIAGFFPWSLFLVQAITQKIKLIWQDRQQHATDLFLLLWLFIVFVFFSIPHSKTVGYILPLFPVMAMLVGSYLSNVWHTPNTKGVKIGFALFLIVSGVLATAVFTSYLNKIVEVPILFIPAVRYMGVTFLIASVASCFLWRKKNLTAMSSCLFSTIIILSLIFMCHASTINEKSTKPMAMKLKPLLTSNDEIISFYKYYHDLPIYLERRITVVTNWHNPEIPLKDNWVREMWYGMVFQDTKNWLIEEDTFWKRWKSTKRLYVVTDEDNYNSLKIKTKVYKIFQDKDIVLLSNHKV